MDNTPLFIETICIKNQKIQLIDYHNDRTNKCISTVFNNEIDIDLNKFIDINKATFDLVKCRIIYSNKIESIEYHPYSIRPILTLQTVDINAKYTYNYKSLDRSRLEYYFGLKGKSDDIIMIQNGRVTDSYYANLAFLKDSVWYTPSQPLLEGTKRAYLLDQGKIIEKEILKEDIIEYEKVMLFNAMIDFGEVEISVSEISF